MIYDWSQCNRDEASGTAKCMADIHPDDVWSVIIHALGVAHRLEPRVQEAA